MYRGSSFLLQKDYKVHEKIVKELFQSKYDSLWGISLEDYEKDNNINLLMDLVGALKDIYRSEKNNSSVSDTLITKVLLGTLGCVPAYDRYFIRGVHKTKVASGCFGKNSIQQLVSFYKEHKSSFEDLRKTMKVGSSFYPPMKVLDSCFWHLGKEK